MQTLKSAVTLDNCKLEILTASVLPLYFSAISFPFSILLLFTSFVFKIRGTIPWVRHTRMGLIIIWVYVHSCNGYSNCYKLRSVWNQHRWKSNFVPLHQTNKNIPSLCLFLLHCVHVNLWIQANYASDKQQTLTVTQGCVSLEEEVWSNLSKARTVL